MNFLSSLPLAPPAPVIRVARAARAARVACVLAIGAGAVIFTISRPLMRAPKARSLIALPHQSGENSPGPSTGLEGLEAKLKERLRNSALKNAKISREKSAIQITIQSDSVFKAGSAEVEPEFEPGFRDFALWLSTSALNIQIESHTDHSPVVRHRNLFHSNWELSAARAAVITSFLEQSKIPLSHLQATAFADSRPLGDDPELNRRIVIRLSPEMSGS